MSYEARYGSVVAVPPGAAGSSFVGLVFPDVDPSGSWVIAAQFRNPTGPAFRYQAPPAPSPFLESPDNRSPAALRLVFGRGAGAFEQLVAVPVVGLMLRVPERPSRVDVIRQKDTSASVVLERDPTPFELTLALLDYAPSHVRYPLTLRGPDIVPMPPEAAPGWQTYPVRLPDFARRLELVTSAQERHVTTGSIGASSSISIDLGASGPAAWRWLAAVPTDATWRAQSVNGSQLTGDTPLDSLAPYALPPLTRTIVISNDDATPIASAAIAWTPGESAYWLDAEGLNSWQVDTPAVPELARSVELYGNPVTDRGVEAVA